MNSWFDVGEEVVIQSVSNPQYNGKSFIIKNIFDKGERYQDRANGYNYFMTDGPGFLMEQVLKDATESDGRELVFNQSALRKKHKPSDESFKDMMQNIKSDVRIIEGVV